MAAPAPNGGPLSQTIGFIALRSWRRARIAASLPCTGSFGSSKIQSGLTCALAPHYNDSMLRRSIVLAPIIALVAGCALLAERSPDDAVALPYVKSFASLRPNSAQASGWQEWSFSRFKKPTRYELVTDSGDLVIKATADGSASGLRHSLKLDSAAYPLLTWRWKVNDLIESADNTLARAEDSPVRLLVTFDGDIEKLSLAERLLFDNVFLLTGRRMPYATLAYIWENRLRKGTVVPSAHTSRIKMIVAESGRENVGRWQTVTRNVVEDFRLAFGEEPGRITSIGIMTDTDNTGTKTEAFYGDIRFLRARRLAAGAESGDEKR